MPERDGLITTAELADILGQPDLRLFDCTTYLEYQPEGSDVPYLAVPGRHTFEAGHIPGADFLDLQGEFSASQYRASLHDARHRAARGRVRPSRHRRRQPGRAVLDRHRDVGDAVLVDAEIARLRERRGAGWRARHMEGGGPRGRDRTGEGISAGDLHRKTAGRIFRRQARRRCRPAPIATPSSSTRSTPQLHKGLEPSRYGRAGRIPGSVNVSAATLIDPATKAFLPLAEAEAKFAAQGIDKRQARGRLLRRRHLRHHRPVPAAPARLRQSHAVRRLDGRMGEG